MSLESSVKITKIRIMECKTDEGWPYEWCNYYTTIGYLVVTDKKDRVIENRYQNT